MIWMMERHFPFPYATPQIYASPGCNAENSNFNMKTQREILFLESFLPFGKSNSNMKTLGYLRECFFSRKFLFPLSCLFVCFGFPYNLFVCRRCLGESRSKTETFDSSACGSQLSSTTLQNLVR